MSPEARQQIQEKLQGMSPDERRQFVQQMRQRRGQGGPGAMPGSASSSSPRPGLGGGDGRGGREMLPGGDMRRGLREQSGASGPGRGGSRARPGGMQGGRQWFGRQPIRLDRLNLSEKQKQRIQTMRQGNATRAREVNKQLRSKRAHLKEMLFDPGASQEQILEQQAQYSTLRNQADEIMLNDFLGIRSVLTKEQLNRLPEIKPGTRTKTGTASKKSSRAK
ncbi:MAG: periplasmic heavy metal sensor [Cyanobacteriota/Melainabacteria group bacterium]